MRKHILNSLKLICVFWLPHGVIAGALFMQCSTLFGF